MLTDLARDHAFTIAWFGLMAFVWFGWGQEDPPPSWRWRLGLGSGVGVVLAGLFGYAVARRWDDGTALEGRYEWFGLLVLAEVVLAGAGCLVLARRGAARWMSWWVALVVALHLLPLAVLLNDAALVVLGLAQLAGLLVVRGRLATAEASSRLVGPLMGATFLCFAVVSAVVLLARSGSPW